MHQPIPEQGRWPRQVVAGFFAYHAIPTNGAALETFHHYVTVQWLADDWLPKPRILKA